MGSSDALSSEMVNCKDEATSKVCPHGFVPLFDSFQTVYLFQPIGDIIWAYPWKYSLILMLKIRRTLSELWKSSSKIGSFITCYPNSLFN